MNFLSILSWIGFGFFVGAIGRLLVPGRQAMGWLGTISLGLLGSFAGGFLQFLLWGGEPLQPGGILMSVLGAILLVVIGLSMSQKKHST